MTGEPEKQTVLVADDDAQLLGLVSRHLKGMGYHVIEALDGEKAWDLAKKEKPCLVVLDVMMPGMSGWEVCRSIRESDELTSTKIIMLTGIGARLNEMTSPLYGAHDYLDKPFEFDALEKKVKEIMAACGE